MSDNDDVIECVSVHGVVIELANVSHDLRRQYHQASAAVGRNDKAKAKLNAVGEAILAEQMPNLAIKYAKAVRGTGQTFDQLIKRSR